MKILFKPTTVVLTKKLRKNAIMTYGEDYASLMFASMKNLETKSPKNRSGLRKFLEKFYTKTKLSLKVDINKQETATVQAQRKIGTHVFEGTPVEFDIESTIFTLKQFKNSIAKSKESVLEKINQYKKHGK